MAYGGWGELYRSASRWIGDASGEVGRWYDRNRQYLPSNNAALSGMGFVPGAGIRSGIQWAGEQFNRKWNESHGADRYWLSQVPFWGWGKQMQGQADYYEDYYRHTGVDPKYPQVYGGSSSGLAGSLNSAVGSFGTPARWARALDDMFPVRYQENLSRSEAFSKGYW